LFVALRGENFDGHSFVADAIARGAVAALVDTTNNLSTEASLLVVKNTRTALIDLSFGYRKSLALQTVAITGSAGKTTVKEMTADVLAAESPTARTIGNFNNDIGVPLSLLATERENRFGVFEVGMNHPGELAPLCKILKPSVGIVTSVGPVHLEFFENEAAIAEEKAEVFRALRKSGRAVLCRDEKWFDVLRAAAKCRVITTSLRGGADYVAKIFGDGSLRFSVTENSSGDVVEFNAPLPGDFIVHDALLAIATGRHFGVSWPKIITAIAGYRAAPMRWQREDHRGVAFINDCYNANPLSMKAALDAFAAMKISGKKWVVLAGMRELGTTEREQHAGVGRAASRPEFAGLIAIGERGGWIADAAREIKIFRAADVSEAAKFLGGLAKSGDAVLLKASRCEKLERVLEQWKNFQSLETRA
jgi:UDP-N-acetylmuramoyl-tripeptide--D-alanyl-D-alanine ligase